MHLFTNAQQQIFLNQPKLQSTLLYVVIFCNLIMTVHKVGFKKVEEILMYKCLIFQFRTPILSLKGTRCTKCVCNIEAGINFCAGSK